MSRNLKKNRIYLIITAVFIMLLTSSCAHRTPAEGPAPSVQTNTIETANNANSSVPAADPRGNTGNVNNAENFDNIDNTNSSDNTNKAGNAEKTERTDNTNKNTNENNTVLTETEYADQSYIDETLFLGDSNTAFYLRYADDKGNPYTTVENTIGIFSMGIEHIQYLQCMSFSTGVYTIPASVSIFQPRRMIIMFGTNNLKDYGVQGAAAFANDYAEKIKLIQDAYPAADIIINSVPPATMYTTFWSANIETIKAFNEATEQMCAENGWKFLNSFEALIDDSGYGDPELFIDDGLHLNQKGVDTMFNYIRSHALYTEDRRTMPLSEIPQVNGPYTEMLLQ